MCEENNNQIKLSPVKYGTTWDGLTQCSFSSDGTAFGDSLASVDMIFSNADGDDVLTLQSSAGDITIDNAATWEFTVDPILQVTLARGTYAWVIRTVDAGGVRKEYISGTIEII